MSHQDYETEPNEDGIFTRVEHVINEKGQKVKITTKNRLVSKLVRVNKNVLERRQWQKFGINGPEKNVSYQSPMTFVLDLKVKHHQEQEIGENKVEISKPVSTGMLITCRNCNQAGHFTAKCPKNQSCEIIKNEMLDLPRESKKFQHRHDSFNICISNLTEDATEDDVKSFCQRFGIIFRVKILLDDNKNSRGVAFVNFKEEKDALKAIKVLHRHPYDHQILKVEMAKEKKK